MYDIHWKSQAMKQLARIDSRDTRDAIYASVQSLVLSGSSQCQET
jgi:hypothetical protein